MGKIIKARKMNRELSQVENWYLQGHSLPYILKNAADCH